MKISISTFFFVLIAFFAFNTSATAQTCEPGLEQIPPTADSDWSGPSSFWHTLGNQMVCTKVNLEGTGNLTHVKFVRGASATADTKTAVYNLDQQLLGYSNVFDLAFVAINAIDTVSVPLITPIDITGLDSCWVCANHPGNNARLVRKFDGAEGTRLHVQNFFNDPFIADISNIPTESGLYAIWAIVEDCVEPSVPGCTEQSACNYNPLATENDMTCDWSCLGGCERCDANGDGVINSVDLNAFLGVYGTPAVVGADLLDSNNDGVYTAADLLNIFGCFGQALSSSE